MDPGMVLVFEGSRLMDIVPEAEAGEEVEKLDGTLLPGIINTHCHLELSHLKGIIPQHTGLVAFLKKVMTGRSAGQEEIEEAMLLADRQMWANGIQAVGDICNTTDSISIKKKSPICYHSFIEVAGFPPQVAEQRFAIAKKIQQEFDAHHLSTSITPHAPYSVSAELLKKIDLEVGNGLFSMHNQESDAENQLFLNKQGDFLNLYAELGIPTDFFLATRTRSLQSWLSMLHQKSALLLVHDVAIKEEDIGFLKSWINHSGSFAQFAICAGANQYISGIMPPVEMMIGSGVPITIGTDSLASNTCLNPAHEINLLEAHFPQIDIGVWLKAACGNGSEALLLQDQFGHLSAGTKPGLVLMKGEKGQRVFNRMI